jgi:hypothetical protein
MRKGFKNKVYNKLNNKKVAFDGIEFASIREKNRYLELKILERAGKISNLELQKRYELIPAHYETVAVGEYYKIGAKKGQPKTKQICVERAVDYIADFVYKENGQTVVEDAKGYREPSSAPYAKFVLKRKMMLYFHGIRIKEV